MPHTPGDTPSSHAAPSPTPSHHRARKHSSAKDIAARNLIQGLFIPLVVLLGVLGLVALAVTHWPSWEGSADVQKTDDAQVQSDVSNLAARIAGTVLAVRVKDFQRVKAGDVLIELDPAEYKAALDQAQAGVDSADATIANLESQIALQQALIRQTQANVASNRALSVETAAEKMRQERLLPQGASTQQKVEQAVANSEAAASTLGGAKAAVTAAARQLDILIGTRKLYAAQRASAQAALETAKLHLSYTQVVAPYDGVVSARQAQQGNYVTVGTRLISIVPLPSVYVVANFRETQLARVGPGTPAEIRIDGLPDVTIKGHVERVSPASGAQFALLPPDNATGNFTKVVQRIPVRIALDASSSLMNQLRSGMNVVVTIDTGSTRIKEP